MYSQNDEEKIILDELRRLNVTTGRFLEIGAWDGKGFSNTYQLAEDGWKGVCVEPSPFVFPSLIKNHASHPEVVLVNAAVAPSQGKLVEWYDSHGDAISTTSVEHKNKWEAGWKVSYSKFLIYTMPLSALFDQFGFDFEVINIDVENTNGELYRALPFAALKNTRILCVEHDNQHFQMLQQAEAFGFKGIGLNGENVIMSR